MNNIILVILCYLIGNISLSIILTKIKLKKDIRNFGSGNAGATNVLRVLGKKYAIIVLLCDALKGVVAVLIGKYFGTNTYIVFLCGIVVIAGHNWPILLGFKGGKGVATTIGVLLAYNPLYAGICVGLGILVIILSKMVSLGSVIGMLLLPLCVYFIGGNKEEIIFSIVIGLFGIFQHRSNIKRLLSGQENKIGKKIDINKK